MWWNFLRRGSSLASSSSSSSRSRFGWVEDNNNDNNSNDNNRSHTNNGDMGEETSSSSSSSTTTKTTSNNNNNDDEDGILFLGRGAMLVVRLVWMHLAWAASGLLWIYGALRYGQVRTLWRSREQAASYKRFVANMHEDLPKESCQPVLSQTVHEAISHPNYGWFREDTYHVPLEIGKTVMTRKRALRHQNTLGALLLIHGFAQNRFAWHTKGRSLANYLAESGYDVFFLDLRGSRESLRLGALPPHGFHEYIEIDIRQALKIIRRESSHKKVYLVGHSMGAFLSCAAAGMFPNLVGGVVHIAGVYGFSQHTSLFWKTLVSVLMFFRRNAFPHMPPNLMIPTREIGQMLELTPFILNNPIGEMIPLRAWAVGSVENKILTEYIHKTFESSTVGVLQCITDLGIEDPSSFGGEEGSDYFRLFERLQIPLLVICADKDDIVNTLDSLKCFDKSTSTDKSKLVFVANGGATRKLAFGHCDILIGTRAVTHVWEQIRLWLDDRRKLSLVSTALPSAALPQEQTEESTKVTADAAGQIVAVVTV